MAAHVETGTMNAPTNSHPYQSQALDHLGLVAGMVDELGLVEQIDRLLPKDREKGIVSHGQAVKAMILNGLGFMRSPLYLTPEFFRDKPVKRLLGEGIEAAHLNEYTLGRTLDALHAYGLEKLYAHLSGQAVTRLGLVCRKGHLDSTSFHVDGRYNSANPPPEDSGEIHITRGYSRDHRPDLNQVIVQLICENQAGIPLRMMALSGNCDDKTSFRETVKAHVGQLRKDVGLHYLIADSALYTEETLRAMTDIDWISRVPETITLARQAIERAAPDLMVNPDEQAMTSIRAEYGGIQQRWLIVYSPEAYRRSRHTLGKSWAKQSEAEWDAFTLLCKQEFACEADARTALEQFQKKLKLTTLETPAFVQEPRYDKPGRPAKAAQPERHVIRITATMATLVAPYQQKLARKSCFIVATNELDAQLLPEAELLQTYKDQQKVERGFRFLKDPLFMASTLFLKSVTRIMALTAIMTLCLLVYAALEYRIRKALKEVKQTFPNQLGKPVTNPTTRWVFQCFAGIHLLIVDRTQTFLLNMNERHWSLLRLLGKPYEQIYS